ARSRSSNSSAEVVVGPCASSRRTSTLRGGSANPTGWVSRLAGGQRELVPAGTHHANGTARLAHRFGSQPDEPLDLRLPIRGDEIEPLPPATVAWAPGAAVPGDLPAAGRGLDRGLVSPITHERPGEGVPPETARLAWAFAGDLAQVPGAPEEIGAGL